jgi:hypothetical protein
VELFALEEGIFDIDLLVDGLISSLIESHDRGDSTGPRLFSPVG